MWPALSRFLDAPAHSHPRRLRALLDEQGGFTVRLHSARVMASGICVCTRPRRSMSFTPEQWSDHVVDEWVLDAASQPWWRRAAIGGWVDPSSGMIWLDHVRIVPAPLRRVALLMGRLSHQHCVFDLARRQTLLVR